MRRTVDLDSELETELSDVVSLTKEKPAVGHSASLAGGPADGRQPISVAPVNSFEMAFRMQVVAPITAPYQSALRRLSTLVKQ